MYVTSNSTSLARSTMTARCTQGQVTELTRWYFVMAFLLLQRMPDRQAVPALPGIAGNIEWLIPVYSVDLSQHICCHGPGWSQ